VYSNIAFALLGMVVEAATGQSFADVVQTSIFDEFGMNSSSFGGFVSAFNQSSDPAGFVPAGDPTWNGTLGVFESYVSSQSFTSYIHIYPY
jgi:CubicO group peptidase (beta-lactamase class C family)